MKQKLINILQPLYTVCLITGITLLALTNNEIESLILLTIAIILLAIDIRINQPRIHFSKVSFNQYAKDIGSDTKIGILDEYLDIKLPQRATQGSAGHDFFSPCSFTLEVGETIKLPTGIRVRIDNTNKFLMIVPRSSLGFKYRMQLDNGTAIVDKDYFYSDNEGSIFLKLTNDGKEGKVIEINKGDAIAQGIFVDYGITKDDNVKTIRNGGTGSTNRKVNK